jgi:hypothetical protein
LYELFGGWIGVQKTPARVVLRQRLRIIADGNIEYEQEQEAERKRKEAEREAKSAGSGRR